MRLRICSGSSRRGVTTIATGWRRIFRILNRGVGAEQVVGRKPTQPDVTHQERNHDKHQGQVWIGLKLMVKPRGEPGENVRGVLDHPHERVNFFPFWASVVDWDLVGDVVDVWDCRK